MLDPSTVALRSPPTKTDDLMISATSSWIVAYDNLSHLQDWLSDALCRLCTGGGLSKRELFTDSDEGLLEARRPVVINGIGELVERSDLLDRAIMLELPIIADADYEAEEDFWVSFYAKHAEILGGLCDVLAGALENVGQTKLESPTRMADFAKWVTAAEGALGWEPGSFIESFTANRGESHELAVEASLIGAPLRVVADGGFEGTFAELLNEINDQVEERVTKQREWPKTPRGLSSQLTRLAPNLRRLGYTVEIVTDTNANQRVVTLGRAS